jgi:hypothetical protein
LCGYLGRVRDRGVRHCASLLLLPLLLLARSGAAKPELHVGVTPALALTLQDGTSSFAFHGALSTDLLLLRERPGEFGVGPMLELATLAFDDVRPSALALGVVPLGPLDLGVALGPSWFSGQGPGAAARGFLGYRIFNYGGTYGTAIGLAVGADRSFENGATTWNCGVHLDGMWLSLPLIALASWISH